jgi:hypothetical protein
MLEYSTSEEHTDRTSTEICADARTIRRSFEDAPENCCLSHRRAILFVGSARNDLITSSGKGRCNALASFQGARNVPFHIGRAI